MLLVLAAPMSASALTQFNLVGTYTINFHVVDDGNYPHSMMINKMDLNTGDFSGTGNYNVNPSYTWTVTGNLTGSNVTFHILYTGSNAGYYVDATGTVAADGTMSGTAASGSGQQFTWTTTNGKAMTHWPGEVRSMGYYKNNGIPLPPFPEPAGKVAATGAATSVTVQAGKLYMITASGTYFAGGNYAEDIESDAKYSITHSNASPTWTDSVADYLSYGPTLLDLQINNGAGYQSPNWGPYSSGHTYSIWLTAATNTLNFKIYDIFYPNNTGDLDVTVGWPFSAGEIQAAIDNYGGKAAWPKFVAQYGITLCNLYVDPSLANAIFHTGGKSSYDGKTVGELATIASSYSMATPKGDLLGLKDVFDMINNGYVWTF
jgi:hypothetical protein